MLNQIKILKVQPGRIRIIANFANLLYYMHETTAKAGWKLDKNLSFLTYCQKRK